jgi:hypothetical protein
MISVKLLLLADVISDVAVNALCWKWTEVLILAVSGVEWSGGMRRGKRKGGQK